VLGAVLVLLAAMLGSVGADVATSTATAEAAVVVPATATASATAAAAPAAVSSVGAPSWWRGDCDTTRWGPLAAARGWTGEPSHRLGASWMGVPVCGPRPAVDGSPDVLWGRPGWGESEWQCVEVAQRFMAQIYGTTAYGANGSGVVSNYKTSYGGGLVKITNGTVGHAPVPGDIVSFTTPSNIYGHVAVIASSTVDNNGNGTVRMLSQNDTVDGWRTLSVVGWRLSGFGSLTPYGWLHDPAGRGNPMGDGSFVRVTGSNTVYRIAGGAPLVVSSWAAYGGPQPVFTIEAPQFARLKAYPIDGTYLKDSSDGTVYRTAGGAPLAVGEDAAKLPGWTTAPVIVADHYALARFDHLRPVPVDRTEICRADVAACYLVAGGAPLLVPGADTGTVPGWTAAKATVVSGAEFTGLVHLRPVPADGTFLCDALNAHCYRVAGGAPFELASTETPATLGATSATPITVAHWELANFVHLRHYPADGTLICPVGDTSCYVIAGRAPLPVTPSAASSAPELATGRATKVSRQEFAHPVHLAARPVDGTTLLTAQSKSVYVVRAGAASYVPQPTTTTAADVATPPVLVDQTAIDNAGLTGPWSHLLSNPASVAMATPSLGVTTASTAVVGWTTPIASSAVTSYTVRYRRATATGPGAWVTPASWQTLRTTHLSLRLVQGSTYCVQVRATNRAGQIGPWSRARCAISAYDERAATARTSTWRLSSSPKLYSGTGIYTMTHGAAWTMDGVTASRVAVVATTCPTCGAITVKLGSTTLGTISLVSPTVTYQVLQELPSIPLTSGTLTLVVRSVQGRLVQLDGVAISRI
jgi:hypothetical protein